MGLIPGSEDPMEEDTVTHCSILAWESPMDRGAWRATVHGVTKGHTQLRDSMHARTYKQAMLTHTTPFLLRYRVLRTS